MNTTIAVRKQILAAATLIIIGGTSLMFQLTQNFYMSFITGERYYKTGKYGDALPYFLAAYSRDPRSMKAAGYVLWTYQRLGMKEKANEMLEKLLEQNPNDLRIVEQLADGLYDLHDYKKAAELYEFALKREKTVRVKQKLAEVLAAQGKYPEAIALVQEMAVANTKDMKLQEYLADLFSWAKKYNESIALYKEIIGVDPKNTRVIFKLSNVLRYAHRDKEAIVYYKMYLEREG